MRFLTSILLFLASLPLFAQGKVSTRAHKLADFPDKVTQVVLTGDPLLSAALQEEVVSGWTASAFECCTLEQFQERMTQDKYYFLLVLDTPGIRFLSLLKGGPEGAKGIGALHEVAALPLMASDGGDGREFTYVGALVQAIQEYTLAARESEIAAYGMEHWFRSRFKRNGKKVIFDADEADEAFLAYNPNAFSAYVMAPANPTKGDYCYKMLFDAETHCLVYLAKHKIDARHGAGFLPDEIKRLSK